MRHSAHSLRFRLTVLVIIGVAPALALLVYGYIELRDIPKRPAQETPQGIDFAHPVGSREAAEVKPKPSEILSMSSLALATLLGLAAASIIAQIFLMCGISALIKVAQQVGAGNFAARSNLADYGGRLGELGRVFDRMAETLQRRETEHREAREKFLVFRSFVEGSGQGLGIAGLDGAITYANPTLLRWGNSKSLEEIKGKRFIDFIPEEGRSLMSDVITPAVLSSGQWTGEMTFRSPNGTPLHSIFNEFLIRDEEGRPHYRAAIITDITSLKKAEKELREALEFQRMLLSTAATAIFTLDLEGDVSMVNDEFCFITGFDRDEIVGRHFSVLGDTTYLDTLDLYGAESDISIQRREGSILTKEGNTLSVLMNHAPLMGDQRSITGFIVSFVDVTEAIQAREAAEKAALAKSEFLANMSHEIRTPIHGIVGMTELTLNTELNSEQREYLDAVRISADALMRLINDILDFSKMEAGKLDLMDNDFSLRDCIGEAMTTLAVQAHSKGLELLYRVPVEIPDVLVGDAGRIRQIIVNLVGNAVKFTDYGEVSLVVELERENESDVWLHCAVKDTGIGIAPEKQHAIFHAFEQADSSTTKVYGGTGLGLTISSHLVRLMGGRIWVESETGVGTTFHFNIRLGLRKAPVAPRVEVVGERLKNLAVLIVDDNATNLRILGETLLYWGMRPTSADGGRAGLAALETSLEDGDPFGLVITDCMMPGMDGFEFSDRIKSDPRFEDIPVIMLTSAGQRGDGARSLKVKAGAYLLKPVKQSELLIAVSRLLQAAAENVRVEKLITRHTIRETQRKLQILLAEDNPVNQKLAAKMLEKMGHTVSIVGNGKAAVEAVQNAAFDVVLMDVRMPEMNGMESTKAIREREKSGGGHVPIIAMTAYAMRGDREKCLAAGMDGYVSKPVSAAELFGALEKIAPGASAAQSPSETRSGPSLVVDRKAVCDQVGGDVQLLRDIIEIFLQDCPQNVALIREAISRRDADALENAAHSLKGSVANFAVPAAYQAAFRLETLGRNRDFNQAQEALDRLEKETQRLRVALEALMEEPEPCK
jgi:two-component system, sensor histidine kinase and response regulator